MIMINRINEMQNRTNEMNWVIQTNLKKKIFKLTLKHLIKFQILQNNNEPFYPKLFFS